MRAFIARQRASATRWRWPPDRSAGRRSAEPASPTGASAASTSRRSSRARQLLHPQRVADVLGDAHVRPQRVRLEHHADVPILGRERKRPARSPTRSPSDECVPRSGRSKPAIKPQQRALAAAGRTEHREELAFGDGRATRRRAPRSRRSACRRRRASRLPWQHSAGDARCECVGHQHHRERHDDGDDGDCRGRYRITGLLEAEQRRRRRFPIPTTTAAPIR